MNNAHWFLDEKGFTIQELVVVLIVGSILISFTLSLFLFTDRLFISWRSKHAVEDMVTYTLNTISLDVVQSTLMNELTDSSIVLTKGDQRTIRYRFRDGKITRDGILLANDSEVRLEVLIRQEDTQKGYGSPLVIKAKGISKSYLYELETKVSIPLSGKEEFIASSTRK